VGKLRKLSGREVCKVLEKHGFVEVRRRGGHVVMEKVVGGCTVTAPIPDHGKSRIGTLSSIIRQPGVIRTEFE
jgi:predicted RNA binding protein YcfA (HicA-like mRNA interferase family)